MTKNKIKNNTFFQVIYIIILILAIFLLVLAPTLSMNTFFDGIRIWATKVLPALLPFFIITKLLSYTQFITSFGKLLTPVTQKIYGVGGSSGYVFLMSIISGYPVGAKILSDLYNDNKISKRQAITITAFTSTSGPLFMLGTVAIGLFASIKLGIIIIISHYIGALLNGLIYRQRKTSNIDILSINTPTNFLSDSMTSSITSIMSVGGFIALFYMLLQLLLSIHIFDPIIKMVAKLGVPKNILTSIICGLIEVTTGAIYLSKESISIYILAPILTFMISFGGLSIHAQAYCFLKNFNMSYGLFFLQKLTQAIVSTIIAIGIMFIII